MTPMSGCPANMIWVVLLTLFFGFVFSLGHWVTSLFGSACGWDQRLKLKLNLRAQLWSEPGLRIKYWLSPEFITIAPTLLVTGQPFLQRRLRLDAGRRLLRWEIDLLRVHTGGSNRRNNFTRRSAYHHPVFTPCMPLHWQNSVTSSCTSTSVRRVDK